MAVSLDFYAALGDAPVSRVDLDLGAGLTMLQFPGEEKVTLELVHRPGEGPVDVGTGFSQLAVQIDNLGATIEALRQVGSGWRPGR